VSDSLRSLAVRSAVTVVAPGIERPTTEMTAASMNVENPMENR
jgi:hypothetical protein